MLKVCKEGEGTLAAEKVPIIFVPGVMGTRLHFPKVNEDWDPDDWKKMWHWVRIGPERERQELHYLQKAEVMTVNKKAKLEPNERDRGWEGVSWQYYGEFLRWLNNLSFSPNICPVYAAPF